MCTALAPGHEAQLGNVDPSEVSYWFRKARFEASRTFWTAKGLRFLEAQLHASNDELRSVCIHQLIEEARAQDEVRLTIRSSGLPMSVCAKIATSAAAAA